MKPLVLVPVVAAALIFGTVVGAVVLPLGLVLHDLILWPLAFGVGALFAAIGGSWVGTLLASDQTRSHLLAVVGVSEAAAAVVTAIGGIFLGGFYSPAWRIPGLGVYVLERFGLGMLIIALAASWATWRFRNSRTHMGWDAFLTLVLAIAVLMVWLLAMFGGGLLIVGVGIAGVALSVVLALWRFRKRRDWLGMDAAITLGLASLAPLIITGTYYVAALFGLAGP